MSSITHPTWCTAHTQEDDGTLLTHRGEFGFETDDGNQIIVNVLLDIVPSLNREGTWIDLHAMDCDLSPADARRAAAALLIAADHADGREPKPVARTRQLVGTAQGR